MEKNNKTIIYKNLFIKVASYIVVLSLIVSVFSINIYAEEPEDDTYLDTYAAHYFKHLTSNFGLNNENTCGYIAAGMLLSFYDSYLNDYFIQDNYDALGSIISSTNTISSPGIKCEELWTSYEEGYTDYNTFIDDKADEFFHLRLLQIGRDELGLYNPTTQNQRSSDSTAKTDLTGWEMDISEVSSVIQKYISTFSYADENESMIKSGVTIHISSYNDDDHKNLDNPNATIRNEVIEKVKAGIPVIYSGYPAEGIGHFMIAYDYDEANDTLYFHTGWIGDHTMNDKDTENFVYTANTAILWFEIDDELVHSHSNNYAYSSSPTTGSLCACQMYSGSLSHTHNYSAIINNSDYRHYSRCICGKVANIEEHSLTYLEHNAVFHTEKCDDCSYLGFVSHEYTTFLSYTATDHDVACDCGVTITEAHYAYRYEMLDSSFHTVYCECGRESTEPHVVSSGAYTGGNKYAICLGCGGLVSVGMTHHQGMDALPRSENGSFILPNGVVVLVDEDIDAYFDGTLEFVYPDVNLETK